MNLYTQEKLRELERERLDRGTYFEPPKRPRKAIFGPLAARTGRAPRRIGDGLEHWGTPPPPTQPEHEHHSRAPYA